MARHLPSTLASVSRNNNFVVITSWISERLWSQSLSLLVKGFRFQALLLFFLTITCILQAQPPTEVSFEGARKHRIRYLMQMIETDDQGYTPGVLEEDLRMLRNLPGIQQAEVRVDSLGDTLKVIFELKERFTLLPITGFGGVRNNIFFRLGAVELNLAGIGHEASLYYQNNDGRNNGSLFYRAPRIGGSQWGASLGILRLASIEPLFFDTSTVYYDYDNLSFGATVIRRFGRRYYIEGGLTYFLENYNKNERHRSEITPGPEGLSTPKYLAKLVGDVNHLRYESIYLEGFDNHAIFQTVYNPADESWFNIFQNDFRYFHKFGRTGNLALRVRFGIGTNQDTPFAPFVLDSYVNIRGVGNRVDRGTATVILNAEYRQTVFDRWLFAGQVVGFSDIGSWRGPGGAFRELVDPGTFRQFMGLGGRFIFKRVFNAVFRLDYGVDVFNPSYRGVVIGIGQYF